MKKLLLVIFSLQLLLVFTTCSKEKRILRNTTWKAFAVEIGGGHMYFTLEFVEMIKNKNTDWFVIKYLNDKYSEEMITGEVKIGHNKIDFHNIQTSESTFGGENSPLTQSLVNFLESVNRYETNGAGLTLKSKNGREIILTNMKTW